MFVEISQKTLYNIMDIVSWKVLNFREFLKGKYNYEFTIYSQNIIFLLCNYY